MMNKYATLCLILCIFAIDLRVPAQEKPESLKEQPAKIIEIPSSDLNVKYSVVGPLGVPLGEALTVEGKVVINEGKGPTELFEVISVDGKKLDQPLKMEFKIYPHTGMKELKKEKNYRLRGFQGGNYRGLTSSVMKETPLVQTQYFHFHTFLEFYHILKKNRKSK